MKYSLLIVTALLIPLVAIAAPGDKIALSKVKEFNTQAEYVEYRNAKIDSKKTFKLDSGTLLADMQELADIYKYESEKAGGFVKTLDDLQQMKADPQGFMETKIKKANP